MTSDKLSVICETIVAEVARCGESTPLRDVELFGCLYRLPEPAVDPIVTLFHTITTMVARPLAVRQHSSQEIK